LYKEINGSITNTIQTVEYDYIPAKSVFSKGAKVAVSSDINANSKYLIGTIGEIQNDYVELITDQSRTYRVKDYKQISTKDIQKNDYITVNISANESGTLKLSYLFSEISWVPHYSIMFDDDKIRLFSLSGTINNNTGKELNGSVTLVAGSIAIPSQYKVRSVNAVQAEPNRNETNLTDGNFGENHKYSLTKSHTLNHTKKLDIFKCVDLDSDKYYVHNVESGDIVEYAYNFISPTFLPEGKVYLYTNSDRLVGYIGTSHMKEQREGERASIKVGSTTRVRINSVVTKSKTSREQDNNNKTNKVNIVSEIKNITNNTISVKIKYYVGVSEMLSTTIKPTRRKNNYLEWDLQVPPLNRLDHFEVFMVFSGLN